MSWKTMLELATDLFFFIPFTFVSITHYYADCSLSLYFSLSLWLSHFTSLHWYLHPCRAFFYQMITLIISRSLSVKQNENKICAPDNEQEKTTKKNKYGKRYLNFVTQWMYITLHICEREGEGERERARKAKQGICTNACHEWLNF